MLYGFVFFPITKILFNKFSRKITGHKIKPVYNLFVPTPIIAHRDGH